MTQPRFDPDSKIMYGRSIAAPQLARASEFKLLFHFFLVLVQSSSKR